MGKKKSIAKALKREREIEEELARRAEKAKASKKKKAKKGKGKKAKPSIDASALGEMTVSPEAAIATAPEPEPAEERHPHLVHLDRVGVLTALIADDTAKKKVRKAAEAELATLRAEGEASIAKMDAELKAKVQAKKAEREKVSKAERRAGIEAVADQVDRSDVEAVRAYNAEAVKVGATLLTSDAEREKIAERTESTVEVVETEAGREFVGGSATAAESTVVEADFAKPSDAEPELEEGRNGYKIIQLVDGTPDPRKVRQLTRVTTFVGNIDDETTLKKWDKRMVVEGLAKDAMSGSDEALIVKVGDLTHRRDVAISNATKADRKGKLGIGEAAMVIAAAEKLAKDELDKIVEAAAEVAGRNRKARAGTHLHSLAEISDAKGIDEVRRMHEEGETVLLEETGELVPITSSDLASIEAYAARMTRLGAKVIYSEAVIVNDEMGYAGRLDRIITAKLPELVVGRGTPHEYVRPADQRARRYVTDIKSGRVDLGGGKIGRQTAAYALGDLYDPKTGERTRHSAARDVALIFHLPQGEGVCHVGVVDLKAGVAGLKLSAEVRRARNTGKKSLDMSVDIADPAPESEA